MKSILFALAFFSLTLPANALDGTRSPANVAPAVGVPPRDIQNWHNPNIQNWQLQRAAKELLEQARQLRRAGADLLAQATPGGTAQGVDPLIGTWKMNPAKSTAVGFEIDKSLTLTFTRDGQNIAGIAENVDAQGRASKGTLIHIYDGKPHPSTGNPEIDATAYTRMGNTISWVRFKNGKPMAVGQGVVDGNIYSVIQGGITASNQPIYNLYVFDRQ
jgi:hypothetical protein